MKKKVFCLILLTLMVMIPINAKALKGSIKIECNKRKYKINETATCKIKGISNEDSYSVSARIKNFKSGVVTMDFKTDKGWQGIGDDGNIQLYTDKGKKGEFNIGVLTIKPKNKSAKIKDLSIIIDDIVYSDTKGKEFNVKEVKRTISFGTSNNVETVVILAMLLALSAIIVGVKKVKKLK